MKEQLINKIVEVTTERVVRRIMESGRNPQDVLNMIVEAMQGTQSGSPYLRDITDVEEARKYMDVVYDIMQNGYSNIGGTLGFPNPRSMMRNLSLLTLYTDDENVYAAAVYSGRLQGYKEVCLGSDGSDIGKWGVRLIIQRDISGYKKWFWCECSGAVEALFKQYDGFPVPSAYVNEILNRQDVEIVDEFHYKRAFGQEHEIHTKVIFGFNSVETFNKVIHEIDNYDELRYVFNHTKETNEAREDEEEKRWQMAITAADIINTVYENSLSRRSWELTPCQQYYIKRSVDILKEFHSDQRVCQNVELGEYMLNNYPLLVCRQF